MLTIILVIFGAVGVSAQADAGSVLKAGLDLYAVAEILKDSENLEKFEQKLNDPETGVNNLDLNEDDAIDFVSVREQIEGDTHLVVLQTALGEDDFQDVAVIAFERESGEKYNLQIQGDTQISGENYYVVPAASNFGAWNIVRQIFRPGYRSYVSTYNYRVLPRWWKPRRPVEINVYRTRTGIFTGRRNFTASRTVTVRSINKVNYRPRTSNVVTRKKVIRTTNNNNGNSNQNKTKTVIRTKTVKGKRQ